MKKTLVIVCTLSLLMGKLMAQQQPLPDGKFEQWKTGTSDRGEPYDDLANRFWESLNILATLPPDMFTGPVTLFKDKGRSGAEGDFCPKMVSKSMLFGENNERIFLPGVVGAMTVIVDNQTAQFGRPWVSRPKAIRGYMKYTPVNGDSASIFVEIYRFNPEKKMRQMIGRVEQFYKNAITDWTVFELPIEYLDEDNEEKMTPDSATVLFVSSAGYNFQDMFACKGQEGSTLWVDDCEFVYDGAANEAVSALNTSVYPNPATDELNLVVEEDAQLILINQAGQVLRRQAVKAGENHLNIGELKPGLYTYQVTGAQKSGSGKFIKK